MSIGDDNLRYDYIDQPAPPEFEGWHRPRKHYVRTRQWIACLREIVGDRNVSEPLSYFGLPGADLLDIRLAYTELCRDVGRPMLFRGYVAESGSNADAASRLEITLQQMKQLPGVDPRSDIKGDRLEACGSVSSLSYQETAKHGPYDWINLDLCDGFFTADPGTSPFFYDALTNLLGLQARRTDSWLMSISGIVDSTGVNNQAMKRVSELLESATTDCPDLAAACMSFFGGDTALSFPTAESDHPAFTVAVNLAMAIWLIQRSQDGLACRVSIRAAFGYQTNPQGSGMDFFSLTFRFKPIVGRVATDAAGLSAAPQVAAVDLCESYTLALNKLQRIKDVDTAVRDNPELREELVEGTAELLEWARYDIDEFRTWVAEAAT